MQKIKVIPRLAKANPATASIPSRARSPMTRCLHSSTKLRASEPGTSEAFKSRAQVGPFSWKALSLFLVTGTGLYYYFQSEKEKIESVKKQQIANQKVGRPNIGGPFSLTDTNGKTFTEQDLKGKFSLVYFGFTNCPDICPEELDKMSTVVDEIAASHGKGTILPVFITCDPARDSLQAMATYIKDFHPTMIGLSGTYEAVKSACKAYRVYFSTPPNAKATDDYLVDHSIFFYLMDPDGHFVDAFGKSFTKDEVSGKVKNYIEQYKSGVRWGQAVV